MKKWLVYLLGIITGVILTFAFAFYVNLSNNSGIVELPKSNNSASNNKNAGKTLFDKPGDCVSRKNFEVQEVLESGDAIALEIRETISGYVFTSDLEVLILAQEGSNFYNKQIVKAPQGKCARQIGNYKYQEYGNTKVIPIIAFK